MEYILLWYCLDDESQEKDPIHYGTDGIVYRVRSKVTYIDVGSRITKIKIEGRYRTFCCIGKSKIQEGDCVELHYLLYRVGKTKQAWVKQITKIRPIQK